MLLIFAQNEPSVSTSDFDLDSMKGVSRYLLCRHSARRRRLDWNS